MASQWTFAFLGGRFDGYRHVAHPNQLGPFESPPEELHLWEEGAVIWVQEEDEPEQPIPNEAERYCLREVLRKGLEARYEHERVEPGTLRDELEKALPEPALAAAA